MEIHFDESFFILPQTARLAKKSEEKVIKSAEFRRK